MASRSGNTSTHDAGRALLAAELERRGFAVSYPARDKRQVDIVAVGPDRKRHLIKVKSIRGPSWQFDLRQFIDVTLDGDRQVLGDLQRAPREGVLYVLVLMDQNASSRFFPMTWESLRSRALEQAVAFLKKHDFVRPRNPASFHTALWPEHVEEHEEDWSVLMDHPQ